MFNECACGKQVKTIYQELNQKGILHRGKPFARNTVYHMLANEKYNGIYKHGEEIFTNIYPRIVSPDIFEIVKNKIEANKYGKHKPEIIYLLKNKVRCGYCGKRVNSDSGTSKNGSIMRYYKCTGKRNAKAKCRLKPIRKEKLENIVLETVIEAFSLPSNISNFAEQVLSLIKKKNSDYSVLNLLKSDLDKIEKSISNLIDCMERGMATDSTNQRLKELEAKRNILKENILLEQTKTRSQITKDDIIKHIITALKKTPRQIIDLLIKEIRLYDNKIEIDFHFVDKKSPDDKNRWGFCFYKCKKIISHTVGTAQVNIEFEIKLFV